jgi:hypothetical protein
LTKINAADRASPEACVSFADRRSHDARVGGGFVAVFGSCGSALSLG